MCLCAGRAIERERERERDKERERERPNQEIINMPNKRREPEMMYQESFRHQNMYLCVSLCVRVLFLCVFIRAVGEYQHAQKVPRTGKEISRELYI